MDGGRIPGDQGGVDLDKLERTVYEITVCVGNPVIPKVRFAKHGRFSDDAGMTTECYDFNFGGSTALVVWQSTRFVPS